MNHTGIIYIYIYNNYGSLKFLFIPERCSQSYQHLS